MKNYMPRSRFRIRLATMAVTLFCLLGGGGCSVGVWYPQGDAEVTNYIESTDAQGNTTCTVTFSVKNTGSTTISRYTVSLCIKTGAHEYYQTVSKEQSIIPGGTVYGSLICAYATPGEKATSDGIRVATVFFE
jgi:hypothetical protein